MGCIQLRGTRILIDTNYDLGNIPSSNESTPTNSENNVSSTNSTPIQSPLTKFIKKKSDFVSFKKNGMNCYICKENNGLLIRMFTCNCANFFAHYNCLSKWIRRGNYKCSICQSPFYKVTENKPVDFYMKQCMSFSTLQYSKEFANTRLECIFLLDKTNKKNVEVT